uniref:hypothetical protein n=1 Tax=Amanita sinensis TaxID=67728 RepID=UPI001D1196B0|nr:hypothetical protein LK379_mgp21 [Amanita sinensis]QZN08168.1 hypothetical protein [Amanita sinensis]
MDPNKLFKIPLSFAGSFDFHNDFNKINNNVTENIDLNKKYRVIYKTLNAFECEVNIVLQEIPSIVIYKFIDKIITVPKLNFKEVLVERIIMSKISEIFIIDLLNNQILLSKRFNVNKQGFMKQIQVDKNIKPSSLNKFITFDIEAITDLESLNKDGDMVYFDPIVISAFDFYNKESYSKIFRKDLTKTELIPAISNNFIFNKNIRLHKIEMLSEFFLQFIDKKYHKFVLYAHNMSNFDAVFILESLMYLSEKYNIKIEPLMRENKLIKIRLTFYNSFYIDFHDSYQLLNSSLDKLSKSFLKDNPEIQKMNNKNKLKFIIIWKWKGEIKQWLTIIWRI